MNILHVIHRYYPAQGGAEKFFQEISERFAQDGHRVSVYTTEALDTQLFWRKGKSRIDKPNQTYKGVNVRRFRVGHFPFHAKVVKILSIFPGFASRGIFSSPSPFVPGLIDQAQAEVDFNIVHAAALPYDSIIYSAFQMTRRNKIPFVISPFFHFGGDKVHRRYNRSYQLKVVKESDKVFVQTKGEFAYLENKGLSREKMVLLGMGINPSELQGGDAERFREKYGISTPIVFYIGPKTYDKGTCHLVEAMQRLWSEGLETTLILAGTMIEDFKEYFSKLTLAIQKKCLLLDYISEEEKKDLLAAGDVFVMPSQIDSFGIAFLEAWFYKKPVIGALAGGIPDVVDHEINGFLINFGDEKKLAGYIKELLKNSGLSPELGERGYQKVVKNYTWDKKFKIVKEEYEKLVS